MTRQSYKNNSNNLNNPNKNICALRVAEALGVEKTVNYLHNVNDIVRAARNAYTVRSRKSSVKGSTVGSIRGQLGKLNCKYFIVVVSGHVLLLDGQGQTIVDTAPRKRDARKIKFIYGVM